jgi:hypothetical protein
MRFLYALLLRQHPPEIVERYRVGNPHMSYRAERSIWSRHPTALLTGAIVIFWLAALDSVRRLRTPRPSEVSRNS